MTATKRPAPPQDRPSPSHTNYSESIALHGRDRVEPLDDEDRDDLKILKKAAEEHGFRLAVRCTACGHWLISRKSILLHLGPVCAKRGAK